MSDFISTTSPKLLQLFLSIPIFFLVLGVLFFIAGKANGKRQRPVAILVFVGPALLLLGAGLVIPAVRTILFSFMDPDSLKFIGFRNYSWMIHDPNVHIILRNTILWILFVPLITTGIGLTLAILLDRMKNETVPKSLIFMPMAISFVGASIIWKFVYEFKQPGQPQIGLLSTLVHLVGFGPSNWMLTKPLNTFLLMIIFVWTQTGFAMVILS